jgi:hypothetical protein
VAVAALAGWGALSACRSGEGVTQDDLLTGGGAAGEGAAKGGGGGGGGGGGELSFTNSAEVSRRLRVPASRFPLVLVPCTFEAGQQCAFTLTAMVSEAGAALAFVADKDVPEVEKEKEEVAAAAGGGKGRAGGVGEGAFGGMLGAATKGGKKGGKKGGAGKSMSMSQAHNAMGSLGDLYGDLDL